MPVPGRHHPEAVEGLLGPAQQLVALDVALVLDVDVLVVGVRARPTTSAITEWSMTSSTGTSGLTLAGSPPRASRASRMAARSTTPGTPVKSCMRTRSGVRAISAASSPPSPWRSGWSPQPATASMSAGRTASTVLVAEQVLQDDLDRVGEPGHVEAVGQGVDPVDLVGGVADGQVGRGRRRCRGRPEVGGCAMAPFCSPGPTDGEPRPGRAALRCGCGSAGRPAGSGRSGGRPSRPGSG